MQCKLVLFLVLGFAGIIADSVENLQHFDGQLSIHTHVGYNGLRKLLQDQKPKAKTKLGKTVGKGGGDELPTKEKGTAAAEKKSKAKKDAAPAAAAGGGGIAMDAGKLDDGSEAKPAAKKPGTLKKKVIDEEDDEDMRFIEEEKKLESDGRDEVKAEEMKKKEPGSKKEKSPKKTAVKKTGPDENADGFGREIEDSTSIKEEKPDAAVEEDSNAMDVEKKAKASPQKKKKQEKKIEKKSVPEIKTEDKDESPDEMELKVETISDDETIDVVDSAAKDVEKLDDDDAMPEEIELEKELPKKAADAKKKTPGKKEIDTKPSTKTSKKEIDTGKKKIDTDSSAKTGKKKIDAESSTKTGEASKTKPKIVKEKQQDRSTTIKPYKNTETGTTKALEKSTTEVVTFPSADEDLHSDAAKNAAGAAGAFSLFDDQLEDEELDVFTEFTELPNKLQETASNVAATIGPGLSKFSETSKTYFTQANQQITESFTPIVGEQVAPVVSSLISYGLLLLPFAVVIYMLERIRSALSLAKVLFFINVYLAAYFLTLVLATFALGSEPMAFFFRHSRSSCVFLQLLQALGFVIYLLLYTVALMKAFSYGGVLDRLMACFQWIIVGLFGLHYYVTVFHRAMAMKVPRTTWKVYLVYSAAFSVMAMFARAKIETSKKEYYYSPVDDLDEAVPVDKKN